MAGSHRCTGMTLENDQKSYQLQIEGSESSEAVDRALGDLVARLVKLSELEVRRTCYSIPYICNFNGHGF